VRPGIITAQTPETILIFEDVIFRNNDFGDKEKQVRTQCACVIVPFATVSDSERPLLGFYLGDQYKRAIENEELLFLG
jgi:hypothetical protein